MAYKAVIIIGGTSNTVDLGQELQELGFEVASHLSIYYPSKQDVANIKAEITKSGTLADTAVLVGDLGAGSEALTKMLKEQGLNAYLFKTK